MSDISVSEIGDIVTAKRNVFDAFVVPVDCDFDETETDKPYAFSDVNCPVPEGPRLAKGLVAASLVGACVSFIWS